MAERQKLLLLEDVDGLGREGDIVSPRPGYARNFLIPRSLAVVADKRAMKMQVRLQEQREKRIAEERQEAEAIAAKFADVALTTTVKVDQDGHMYGSVTQQDIQDMVREHVGVELEKKAIALKHHIKETGEFQIPLKLKEGVTASFVLRIVPEGKTLTEAPEAVQE